MGFELRPGEEPDYFQAPFLQTPEPVILPQAALGIDPSLGTPGGGQEEVSLYADDTSVSDSSTLEIGIDDSLVAEEVEAPNADAVGLGTVVEQPATSGVVDETADTITVEAPDNRPQYYPRFSTPECDKPWAVPLVRSEVYRQREGLVIPGEIPLSDRHREQIASVHTGVARLGEWLDVDLDVRLAPPEQYHLFPDIDTYQEGVAAQFGEVRESRGVHIVNGGIALADDPDDLMNLSVIGHETVHDVSFIHLDITDAHSTYDETGREIQHVDTTAHTGYALLNPERPNDVPNGINEWPIDMATVNALGRAGVRTVRLMYAPLDVIGDTIMHEVASYHREFIGTVEKTFLRGMFTGDQAGVEMIRAALGNDRMDELVRLPGNLDIEGARQAARNLHLPQAVIYLEDWQRRGQLRTNLFGWPHW
jgi:hypothetical protein